MEFDHPDRQKILNHLNQIINIQARLASADFNVDGFMNLVVQQMQNLTPATGVVVELVEGEEMVYRAASGTVKDHVGLRLPKKNSISGLCVAEKKVLRSADTEEDPRVNIAACRLVKARSMVVAPLFHEGNAVGVLKILSSQPNSFSDNDVDTLQTMAGLIGSALGNQISHELTEKMLEEKIQAMEELKKAEEKLRHMANYDFLTNLPNRSFLMDRLNQVIDKAKRDKNLSAVLFLDIDHFKQINDQLGHDVGDELLKTFAQRLKNSIRETDLAARLGGDEFVVLLENVPDKSTPVKIAESIIAKIQEPFLLQGKKMNISTSIGIKIFNNGENSPDEALKQADQALYTAKQAGRNNFKVFEN